MGAVLAQATTLPATLPFSGPDRPYYRYAAELEHALELSMQAAPTAEGGDGAAVAYVQGVADTVQGSAACPTPAQRSGELTRVVQAYLAANPGLGAQPAATVVRDALRRAYPCKGR
jgi:hypothetical protein